MLLGFFLFLKSIGWSHLNLCPVSSVLECIHADLQTVSCSAGVSLDDLSFLIYQSNEAGLEEHGTDFPHTARITGLLIAVPD